LIRGEQVRTKETGFNKKEERPEGKGTREKRGGSVNGRRGGVILSRL